MSRTIVGLIVALVLLQLLNVPQVRFIQVGLVVFYVVVLGLSWVFTGNKPGRQHIVVVIGLVLGPTLLIALGSDVLLGLRAMDLKYALLVVLVLILAILFGPRLLKK